MKFRFSLTAAFLYLIGLALLQGIYGCANIVPPSGGAIDSLPPKLVKATPRDSALRFSGNKILLIFNEFIELKSPNDEIIISPYPEKQPLITSNLKTISIKLKDSLLPNTTYTIDFGHSIADINEGNILKDLSYTFSTGDNLDMHSLNGRVWMAESGKADSTMWALLYKEEEDSTVAKKKPSYVARVNGKGFFQFSNLPQGRYYVYALKDADGNKKYNQPIEAFAFYDKPVDIPNDTSRLHLYAFAVEKEKKRERSGEMKKTDKISFTSNVQDGVLELMDTVSIQFSERLSFLDTNAFFLKEDSSGFKKISAIRKDTSHKKVYVMADYKPGSQYQLMLSKAFAKDSSGRTLSKNDTLRFRVKTEKEYGSLKLSFQQLDMSKNPVIQLLQNEQLIYHNAMRQNDFFLKLAKPGSYQLQILYDLNGNGMWDTGDYFSKPRHQPEIVQFIDKEIVIKQNWDNEFEIILPLY
jgi:uncharacterized protein (DUF2141 family)